MTNMVYYLTGAGTLMPTAAKRRDTRRGKQLGNKGTLHLKE